MIGEILNVKHADTVKHRDIIVQPITTKIQDHRMTCFSLRLVVFRMLVCF